MIWQNIRLALKTVRSNKLRSALTMLGIIIGVSSVTTVVSLGNGFKQQIQGEITGLGANLVSVVSGDFFERSDDGNIAINDSSFRSAVGISTITVEDLNTIKDSNNVVAATPIVPVSGVIEYKDEQISGSSLVATDGDLPDVLSQSISRGSMFRGNEEDNIAVIGSELAEDLFGSRDAVTGLITVRGEKFVVTGVIESDDEPGVSELAGFDFGRTVYIPLAKGATYNQGSTTLQRISFIVDKDADVDETVVQLEKKLQKNHGGQKDFSFLKQDDILELTSTFTDIATQFVAAIAGISLLVGGIGIMNIMLVSVTERTREIGLRKAIGASRANLLLQFLTESTILSVLGGLIGVGLAYVAVAGISIYTDFRGVFDLYTILIATGVSAAVGIIAGIWPAWEAASKDPIKSLRHE